MGMKTLGIVDKICCGITILRIRKNSTPIHIKHWKKHTSQVNSKMGDTARKTPSTITGEEFQDALSRYDEVVKAVSGSKGSKLHQMSLFDWVLES